MSEEMFDFGSLKKEKISSNDDEKKIKRVLPEDDDPFKETLPPVKVRDVIKKKKFPGIKTIDTEAESFPITVSNENKSALKVFDKIPTKEEAAAYLDLYNFVKKKVVNETDYQTIKGRLFLKKSGWRKFINAFGISIELIEKKVYNFKVGEREDTHAEVRIRAILPSGQSVEGCGIKSLSELYDKNLHNLISNAWTRAVNRAVSDLVGFGEVSAEEIEDELSDEGGNAFGSK